jgi:cytochrome c biogenesis protein CcdA
MMMITASLMLKTITFLTKMQKIEKYIEVIAGLIILGVGLYLILPELLFGVAHTH